MQNTANETKPDTSSLDLSRRLRRNRKSQAIRELIQETRLHPSDLVMPLFVLEGKNRSEEISSMPGIFRKSVDLLIPDVQELYKLGIRGVNLFAVIPEEKKDPTGKEALRSGNHLLAAITSLKKALPEMCVMVDIALDPYTSHGHDGIVDDKGTVLNDATLRLLGKMAVLFAEAGADIVSPSDMMDGRVAFIRHMLDQAGFSEVGILSYAAKYCSAFYGPYREALQSAPKFGDKTTYQLNPSNSREAMLECSMDEWEGADMLMIKPALAYLDIIAKAREQTELPIAAFHVSGEYSMLMAAAQNGWLDGDKALMESLMAIKRAGASFILTYGAKKASELIAKNP